MKVLVATKDTQGKRKNDFCWATEGEFVCFGFECDGEEIDGRCGCRRSMAGVESRKATTTIKVVDVPITKEEYTWCLAASCYRAFPSLYADEKEALKDAMKDVDLLLDIANGFDAGTVLEKRGDSLFQRTR